ncbi:LuxR C-terminal-related transcriptional regulator [Streptomyces sp. NPDC015242]|uniref:helix-turn-helix transcriptional regulator n=1 Tax=Streptomyces sp. NPDC015242 TaxID=3364951 RepID=UPI0036F8C317
MPFCGVDARFCRQYAASIVERAGRAERTREEEARRRLAEGRLRIARDLHDLLAHSITVIGVRTAVAAHDPGDARGPLPGPDGLPGLADAARFAGARVERTVRIRHAPPAVGAAAHRMVQEAPTNAVRHAGPGPGARVSLLSPGPTTRLIERFLRSPSAPAAGGPECLSEREREVLAPVARGRNYTEAAEVLGLSPLTVKTHVSRIMGKLGARDRAQLVIVAHESGTVRPGTSGG